MIFAMGKVIFMRFYRNSLAMHLNDSYDNYILSIIFSLSS